MDTLDKLLDRLALQTGLSDRRISAQLFRLSFGAVTHWRTGRAFPDDEQARRLAELLDLEPAYVAAIVHAERAKTKETKAMWHRVRDAFGKAAMLAVLSAAPFMAPSPAQAGFNNNFFGPSFDSNTHCRRKPRRWLDALGGRS